MDQYKLAKINMILDMMSKIAKKPVLDSTDKNVLSEHVKKALKETKKYQLFKRFN